MSDLYQSVSHSAGGAYIDLYIRHWASGLSAGGAYIDLYVCVTGL